MTQPDLPIPIPRPRAARPRRRGASSVYGWRWRVVVVTYQYGELHSRTTRTADGLRRLMREWNVADRVARIEATPDQGRTWRPATPDQLRALVREMYDNARETKRKRPAHA